MPLSQLEQYVASQGYQLNRRRNLEVDFSKYEKLGIVPHKRTPKTRLYCTVTKQPLNKLEEEVENHIQGRRYVNRNAQRKIAYGRRVGKRLRTAWKYS